VSLEVVATFSFPVERGAILQFARAIGDPNPVYSDATYARQHGFIDVLVPPTFVMVGDAFDPRYPRRPRVSTEGVVAPGGPYDALLHVSQHFEYHRHVTAGECLTVRRLAPREWTKQGRRGGTLGFEETVTQYVDTTGAVVVTATWTDVRSEAGHRAMSTAPAEESDDEPEPALSPDGVVVVRDLTRTQLVMYVGVAGDFHPLHHDDTYARQHDYPSVFAPGMLTMAMTGHAVTDAIGDGVLRTFGGRLTSQVWPGDTLRTRITANPEHAWSVTTVNQYGDIVFDGHATTKEHC